MSGTIHLLEKKKKKYSTNLSFYNSPFLPKKHNHIEIIFSDFRIIYNDPRRFGFFQIIQTLEDLKKKVLHLGPEPFNKKFNINYFQGFIKKKNIIKDLLIDQKFVSGLGNIYANEILFLSRINPQKKAKRLLKKDDCNQIILNSKKVLKNSIKRGGSSIKNFKNTFGKQGNFQKIFKVYQREGLKCKRSNCVGVIQKKISQVDQLFFVIVVKNNNYLIDRYKFSSYTPAHMANTKSAIKRIRRISQQTSCK